MKKRTNKSTVSEVQAIKFAKAVRKIRRTKDESLNKWKK